MTAQKTLDALAVSTSFSDNDSPIFSHWDEAQQQYDAQAQAVLDENNIVAAAQSLLFPDELIKALKLAAIDIANNENLLRVMWYSVWQMQAHADKQYFLPIDDAHPQVNPLSNMLVYLYLTPLLRQQYVNRGFPSDVCEDTMSDLLIWLKDGLEKRGYWSFAQAGWLQGHYRMCIFKLGRLQFEIHTSGNNVHIYRHNRSGELQVFIDGEEIVRDDGLYMSCKGAGTAVECAAFECDEQHARGAVCDLRTGRISPQAQEVNLDEWHKVLSKGEDTLSIHIPASGPMAIESCRESFASALPFFKKHFPEKNIRAFHCASWLMSPYFARYLKEDSNICRFQRAWSIFPQPKSGDRAFFTRVWGRTDVDIATAEQQNSLQRAIITHINNGGVWNDMVGVIFPEDLPFASAQ